MTENDRRAKIKYITYFEFNNGRKTVDANLTKEELLTVIDWLADQIEWEKKYHKMTLNLLGNLRRVK